MGPVAEIRRWVTGDGVECASMFLWCPGCDGIHSIRVEGPNRWTITGPIEDLTVSPSILVTYQDSGRCHSFIRNGVWEFLSDCTHELAGQMAPLVELPDWLRKEDAG